MGADIISENNRKVLARRFAAHGLSAASAKPVGFGKSGTEEGAILSQKHHEMRTR
jgi:hypothetical protein